MASATALLGPSSEVTAPRPTVSRRSRSTPSSRSCRPSSSRWRSIIGTPNANLVVPAPPGRGKTFTMTRVVRAMIAAGMCRKSSTVRAIIVAPTNLALQQWDELRGNTSVKLTTAASLIGRGSATPTSRRPRRSSGSA